MDKTTISVRVAELLKVSDRLILKELTEKKGQEEEGERGIKIGMGVGKMA